VCTVVQEDIIAEKTLTTLVGTATQKDNIAKRSSPVGTVTQNNNIGEKTLTTFVGTVTPKDSVSKNTQTPVITVTQKGNTAGKTLKTSLTPSCRKITLPIARNASWHRHAER